MSCRRRQTRDDQSHPISALAMWGHSWASSPSGLRKCHASFAQASQTANSLGSCLHLLKVNSSWAVVRRAVSATLAIRRTCRQAERYHMDGDQSSRGNGAVELCAWWSGLDQRFVRGRPWLTSSRIAVFIACSMSNAAPPRRRRRDAIEGAASGSCWRGSTRPRPGQFESSVGSSETALRLEAPRRLYVVTISSERQATRSMLRSVI